MTRFTAALVAAAIALPAAAQSPGSTLAKIRDSKTITLGYRADAAPFSFTGEDKQPAGYVVDLCKRVVASIQRDLKLDGLAVKWTPVTAEGRFAAVANGLFVDPAAKSRFERAWRSFTGETVDAAEVAYVTAFLASDKAWAISGELIVASGGAGRSVFY